MFQSREFRRGLEFTLTEALQKRILQDTPYKIADKSTADTAISGEVLEVRQNTLGRNYWTGQPRSFRRLSSYDFNGRTCGMGRFW